MLKNKLRIFLFLLASFAAGHVVDTKFNLDYPVLIIAFPIVAILILWRIMSELNNSDNIDGES